MEETWNVCRAILPGEGGWRCKAKGLGCGWVAQVACPRKLEMAFMACEHTFPRIIKGLLAAHRSCL